MTAALPLVTCHVSKLTHVCQVWSWMAAFYRTQFYAVDAVVFADGNVCGADLSHHGLGKHHKHAWLRPGACRVIQHTQMQVPLTLAQRFLADRGVKSRQQNCLHAQCKCNQINLTLPCRRCFCPVHGVHDNIVAHCQFCGLMFVSLPASANAFVHVKPDS